MEDKNLKVKLTSAIDSLEVYIDKLKLEGKFLDLAALYERAKDLISVVVLNFKNTNEEDLKMVASVLYLCDNTIKSDSIDKLSINTDHLKDLVCSMEENFINRGFLIDSEVKKPQVCY